MPLPQHPLPNDQILERLREFRAQDADWRAGRCFALVYSAGPQHEALLKEASNLYFSENGLNPMAFRSLRTMEAEVVRMTADLLNGGGTATGTMTSGGTESLLLAVKTYRDAGRARGIKRPEIVVPASIHVGVEKGAKLFGVRMRVVPMRSDFRADVDAMRKRINRNTVALFASAPQYPHGVLDPIAELGALARDHDLPLHVDACIGGFVLPFLERLGEPIPAWDFRVPGVTSISLDLHKYGYTAKGASVLLYREVSWLRHQFFVSTEWVGGVYFSPTLPGTRPGGPIAAAWAGMQALGADGYLTLARRTLDAKKRIEAGLRATPGLRVIGQPDATLLAFGSDDKAINIYALADRLHEKGWHFDKNQSPPSLHLTCMAVHDTVVDAFLADVREGVDWLRANPDARRTGSAPMYGMVARMPARGLVRTAVMDMMLAMYRPDGTVPDLGNPDAAQGPLDRAMAKFGTPILDALEQLDTWKQRFLGGRK